MGKFVTTESGKAVTKLDWGFVFLGAAGFADCAAERTGCADVLGFADGAEGGFEGNLGLFCAETGKLQTAKIKHSV